MFDDTDITNIVTETEATDIETTVTESTNTEYIGKPGTKCNYTVEKVNSLFWQ